MGGVTKVEQMWKTSKPQQQRPRPLQELLALLRKCLEYLLRCLTCGCYPEPKDDLHVEVQEAELMEEEKVAVQNLLQYLDSGEWGINVPFEQ